MSSVDQGTALDLVKQRLNRLDTRLDDYLAVRINAAVTDLERTGIVLGDNYGDLMLVVDYTVWAYNNRDAQTGMPDWLRLRRRERWLSQRADN